MQSQTQPTSPQTLRVDHASVAAAVVPHLGPYSAEEEENIDIVVSATGCNRGEVIYVLSAFEWYWAPAVVFLDEEMSLSKLFCPPMKYICDLCDIHGKKLPRDLIRDVTPFELSRDPVFPATGLTTPMVQLLRSWLHRLIEYKFMNQRENHLTTVTEASGAGKTRFLSEISRNFPQLMASGLHLIKANQEFEPAKVIAFETSMSQVLICPITFNSAMHSDVYTGSRGVIMRVIYSIFFSEKLTWSDFLVRCPPLPAEFNLAGVVQSIVAYGRRIHPNLSLILLVDELVKDKDPHDVLATIGVCLDQLRPLAFNCFVSSLSVDVFIHEHHHSGRKIDAVPLYRPSVRESLALLGRNDILDALQAAGNNFVKLQNWEKAIYVVACDCAGHFRSLLTVHQALAGESLERLQAYGIAQVRKKVAKVMSGQLSRLSYELVSAVLSRVFVHPSDQVPNTSYTYDGALRDGKILGASDLQEIGASEAFAPRFTHYALLSWIDAVANEPGDIHRAATLLEQMFALEERFDGLALQQFHLKWEILMRVFYDSRDCDVYRRVRDISTAKHDVEIVARKVITRQYPEHDFASADRFAGLSMDTSKNGFSFTFHRTNKGFDILFVDAAAAPLTGNVLSFIQCKYSFVESKKPEQLTEGNVKTLLTSIINGIQAHRTAKTPFVSSVAQIQIVFVAWRKSPTWLCADRDGNFGGPIGILERIKTEVLTSLGCLDLDPKLSIIILNQDQLERLYGPNLTSRPQFKLEHPIFD